MKHLQRTELFESFIGVKIIEVVHNDYYYEVVAFTKDKVRARKIINGEPTRLFQFDIKEVKAV